MGRTYNKRNNKSSIPSNFFLPNFSSKKTFHLIGFKWATYHFLIFKKSLELKFAAYNPILSHLCITFSTKSLVKELKASLSDQLRAILIKKERDSHKGNQIVSYAKKACFVPRHTFLSHSPLLSNIILKRFFAWSWFSKMRPQGWGT